MWQHIVGYLTGKDSDTQSLASGGEGEQVAKAAEEYVGFFANDDSKTIEQRKDSYETLINHYYDLVTDFYEYGWGQSFHFAPRYQGEDFHASLARHEHFLAHKLELDQTKHVLDAGCGIGGPMRSIARFSGAKITGVNNNDYQIKRCNSLNDKQGLTETCHAEKGNFMHLQYEEETFDAAYAIEATCHAPDRVLVFKEFHKVLKKDGLLALYEWVVTDKYDAEDPEHRQIKHDIEEGDSLPELTHYNDVLRSLEEAGFEIVEAIDRGMVNSEENVPWYASLVGGWSLRNFRHTWLGSRMTHIFVTALETMKVAPQGTKVVHTFLLKARDSLVLGGQKEIFTPCYFVLARKKSE